MCIRDRYKARRQDDPPATQVDTIAIALETGAHAAIRRCEPVSYTHLRAHETVLDLVCRLLLEKKNVQDTNC